MDQSMFKEIGSFTVMLVPIMAAVIWGGKVLLAWFTKTIETEQASKDKLMEELVAIMRETQTAHQAMVTALAAIGHALAEVSAKTTMEHKAIVDCVQQQHPAA